MVLELPLPVVDEDRAYVHLDGVQYKVRGSAVQWCPRHVHTNDTSAKLFHFYRTLT